MCATCGCNTLSSDQFGQKSGVWDSAGSYKGGVPSMAMPLGWGNPPKPLKNANSAKSYDGSSIKNVRSGKGGGK